LRIGTATLTAVITSDALNELKLRRGDEALAIIKATDVMIAREVAEPIHRQMKSRRAAAR
jgi:molybdopterin-binding protein